MVGLGKLGASMAAAIASRGFPVIGVDVNKTAVDLLNAGHAPVQETNLEVTITANKERLSATILHREAVQKTDITFVIVPTPSEENGQFSLRYTAEAFSQIGKALRGKKTYHTVVLTSTVLPGSTRYGLLPILEKESGLKGGRDFGLCYSPEFIALGSVIHDFLNPDFTLIGEIDDRSGSCLEDFYHQIMLNNPSCKRMSIENAELTKIAVNTYITTKITYANMIADLCERIPYGDVDIVTDALGADLRIGGKYLKGAIGYGGPCFPRDNKALGFFARMLGSKANIAETTDTYNRELPNRFREILKEYIRPGSVCAVLGLAYKPNSHIIEESHSVAIALSLVSTGARIIVYDPLAGSDLIRDHSDKFEVYDSLQSCIDDADIVLITNPDPVFTSISRDNFSKSKNTIVVDFWRILGDSLFNQKHIKYIPIGKSRDDHSNEEKLRALWGSIGQV